MWVNGHISLQKTELEVLFLHHSYKFTLLDCGVVGDVFCLCYLLALPC